MMIILLVLLGLSILGCSVLAVFLYASRSKIRFLQRRLRWDKKLERLESELTGPKG